MKKFLFLLLCFYPILSSAYDFAVDGIFYEIQDDGTCYVTYESENKESYSGSITIPSEVKYDNKNYKVTGFVYRAFMGCTNLVKVTLPESIEYYSTCLFMNCKNLSTVSLPNNITEICTAMFWGCTNLIEVNLPQSVKKIDSDAFYNCTSLKYIDLPQGLTTIESSAFNSSGLINIVLPSSLKDLGSTAFFQCKSLESVQLNEGLKEILESTFWGCSKLNSIQIPASVENLQLLNVNNLTLFGGCKNLTQIKVASGNKHYKSYNGVLMDYNKTEVLSCPEGYTGSFSMPNTTSSIHASAFIDCEKLTEIHFSDKISIIPASTFSGCKALKKVELKEGITTISSDAFAFCYSLNDVIIPSTVKTINSKAFSWCTGLKSITSKATTVPSCSDNVFYGITEDNCVLFVPSGCESKYKNSVGWKQLRYITDGTTPVYIASIDVQNSQYTVLNVGETAQLGYTFKPEMATEKEVVWSSVNESIAKVDQNGLVTGTGIGSVEIRCSPQKGNGKYGSAYLVFWGNLITSLNVNPNTLYLKVGTSGEVIIDITPNDAYNKNLKITSTDESVAYAINNIIYAIKEGATIIKYETTDGSNLSAQVIVVVSQDTGIIEIENEKTFTSLPIRKIFKRNQIIIEKGNKKYTINGILLPENK